ncbi:MAG: protein kinase [Byssovorax sp.]
MNARLAPRLARLLESSDHERVLGAFRLVKPLGRGGFAPVWLAREMYGDAELRTVAVKLFATDSLPPGRAPSGSDSSAAARQKRDQILQEARALCRVEHPNVVRFYALAADPLTSVIGLVMEYVQGKSLDKRLDEQRKLSVDEALAVGIAVASALSAVHQSGLIHRDIKPANVVESMGLYKLIDFGIAAAEVANPPAAEPKVRKMVIDDLPLEVVGTKLTALTRGVRAEDGGSPVITSGTVGYIDPASLGARPSPSSDLYSLGAMLFECLTGALPAVAAGRVLGKSELCGAVLDGRARSPSVLEAATGTPEALARVIDALLDPDPRRRPRSAESVAWELERIRLAIAGHARPLPPEDVGPFRGLGRFEESDRDVYFGRGVEIASALEILRARGLLALVGPSGSGKSSLARAGVLPAVADGHPGGWPKQWDTFLTVPGNDPRASIAAALAPVAPTAADLTPDALVTLLAERAQSTGRGVVLLVDQLEELVTLASGEPQAWTVDLLVRLGAQATPGVRCIVAARRDLLDPLLALRDLGRVLTRGMLLVVPMTDATWGEVLDHALDAYGYRLEDEALRSDLLEQLKGTAGAMPLVQFALTELWARRDQARKVIPHSAVEAIGGIAGALEMHAEAVYEGLTAHDPSARGVLRDLLIALTTPQGTRRTCRIDELAGPAAPPSARSVLEALERSRLVVAEEGGLTLAHEALLVQWTRLRAWIAVAREDRLLAEEIEREATAWSRSPSDERVWRKRRLVAAEDLGKRGSVTLSETSRAFVKAGKGAERRARVLAGVAGTAALLAVAFGGLLYVQNIGAERRAAEGARDDARRAATAADENARQATAAERHANVEKERADAATRDATLAQATLENYVRDARSIEQLKQIQKFMAQQKGHGNEPIVPAGGDPKQPGGARSPAPPLTPITTSTAVTGPGDPP